MMKCAKSCNERSIPISDICSEYTYRAQIVQIFVLRKKQIIIKTKKSCFIFVRRTLCRMKLDAMIVLVQVGRSFI